MNIDKWKTQIVKGTLEYCILLILSKKTYYGYELLQKLNTYPSISSTESTVYPLLRRLQKEGFLSSFWKESSSGLPPRKYYSITELGKNYLVEINNQWNLLLNTINDLKGE